MKDYKYKENLKKQAKQLSLPSFASTGEILEEITHQAAKDLLAKVQAGAAGPKDFLNYTKLVEGHCRLENVKLKQAEQENNSREFALEVLKKLGLTEDQIEALTEEPLLLEESDAED
jgi:histidinol dehydrogenase